MGAGPVTVGFAGGAAEGCGFADGAVGVGESHAAARITAASAVARYLIMLITSAASMDLFDATVFGNF